MQTSTIYLIGFMGCGKSTVGTLLAEQLHKPFIDLDAYICEESGMSIPTIFQTEGELGFRNRESQALHAIADQHAIVATGGGVVTNERNIQQMKKTGIIICLHVGFDVALQRIQGDPNRPLASSASVEELQERYRNRQKQYSQSDQIITVDAKTPQVVVDEIKTALRKIESGYTTH
ncbi:MAG: shikimate kinase [Bacilli bacterium]